MKNNDKALLLAVSLALLCGCGQKAEEPSTPEEEKPAIVVRSEDEVPTFEEAVPEEPAAETAPEEPEIISDTEVRERDLDGDGIAEHLALREEETPDGWTLWSIAVTDAGGRESRFDSAIWSKAMLRTEDLDGDGRCELLLWGDEGSDDPVTYVLRWENGEFRTLAFETGRETDDTLAPVAGCVLEVNGSSLTLEAWQYVLGTYGGRRVYELGEDDVFRPAAGSIWEFTLNTRWLKTKTELSGALEDGTSALPAGTRLRLLGWDGIRQVYFELEDGRRGVFVLSRGEVGWTLGGLNEFDAFESLPYAG